MEERLKSSGIPENKITTYIKTRFTTGNVDWILKTARNKCYSQIVVPEESYLSPRPRATFQSRKKVLRINNLKIRVVPVHSLKEFFDLHKPDVALYLLCEEVTRLRDYSGPERPGPSAFKEKEAFQGSEKFGGFQEVEKMQKN